MPQLGKHIFQPHPITQVPFLFPPPGVVGTPALLFYGLTINLPYQNGGATIGDSSLVLRSSSTYPPGAPRLVFTPVQPAPPLPPVTPASIYMGNQYPAEAPEQTDKKKAAGGTSTAGSAMATQPTAPTRRVPCALFQRRPRHQQVPGAPRITGLA